MNSNPVTGQYTPSVINASNSAQTILVRFVFGTGQSYRGGTFSPLERVRLIAASMRPDFPFHRTNVALTRRDWNIYGIQIAQPTNT